jgi:hypothetical protein
MNPLYDFEKFDEDDRAAIYLHFIALSCSNCLTKHTPQWRKGYVRIENTIVPMCNGCGLRFAKNQTCKICGYVYVHDEIREGRIIYDNDGETMCFVHILPLELEKYDKCDTKEFYDFSNFVLEKIKN